MKAKSPIPAGLLLKTIRKAIQGFTESKLIWVFFLVFSASMIFGPSIFTTSDPKTLEIAVPTMSDDMAVRVITNAAAYEISGRYDERRKRFNECQVDIDAGVIIYSEREKHITRHLLANIESAIHEVGMNCRVLSVRASGHQYWADRTSAVIHVPEMTTNTAANIVVSAIAYARADGENENILIDRENRRLTIKYESLLTAPRNIEQAIAFVGHTANGTRPNLGRTDALPLGWDPIRVRWNGG